MAAAAAGVKIACDLERSEIPGKFGSVTLFKGGQHLGARASVPGAMFLQVPVQKKACQVEPLGDISPGQLTAGLPLPLKKKAGQGQQTVMIGRAGFPADRTGGFW